MRATARQLNRIEAAIEEIRATLKEYGNALNVDTAGGLGAIMDEVRRGVAAAESAHESVEALAAIKAPAPRRGATELRKTAAAKVAGGKT